MDKIIERIYDFSQKNVDLKESRFYEELLYNRVPDGRESYFLNLYAKALSNLGRSYYFFPNALTLGYYVRKDKKKDIKKHILINRYNICYERLATDKDLVKLRKNLKVKVSQTSRNHVQIQGRGHGVAVALLYLHYVDSMFELSLTQLNDEDYKYFMQHYDLLKNELNNCDQNIKCLIFF